VPVGGGPCPELAPVGTGWTLRTVAAILANPRYTGRQVSNRQPYTSATVPDPERPKNIYLREDQVLPHLAALSILLAGGGTRGRARRAGITAPARTADLIEQLRATGTVLTYDPGTRTVRAGDGTAVAVTAGKRS
jgi:hypothetical protein